MKKFSFFFLSYFIVQSGGLQAEATDLISNDGGIVFLSEAFALEGNSISTGPFRGIQSNLLNFDGAEEINEVELKRIKKGRAPEKISQFQSESVIGMDTRVKLDPYDSNANSSYPATATVLISFSRDTGDFICSGAMIGKDTVLTAAHCLHSGGVNGSWSSDVLVVPAYSETNVKPAPFGACRMKNATVYSPWINSSNRAYDVGVVKLNCNIGNRTGWYGLKKRASINRLPTIINGYPGDKPKLDQWLATGWVLRSTKLNMYYKADTFGGMSGSPVWVDDGKGPYILGVHTAAGRTSNLGTRITTQFHDSIVSMKRK